jgi:predicted regulator of Ras-like GTPase activity (Roadblock/LC7/MglB family)
LTKIDAILEAFRQEVPGFISTDLVNVESGLSLGGATQDPDFDSSIAAASFAEVVKANRQALDLLRRQADEVEDILITTRQLHVLIRLLGSDFCHVLAVSRRGDLGLARAIMRKYLPALLQATG